MTKSISTFVHTALHNYNVHPSADPVPQYSTPNQVYLGHSDWMPMRALDVMSAPKHVSDFAICGLAGLNFITPLSPSRIIFTDINPSSLFFALGLCSLILACPTRAEWAAALFGKSKSAAIAYLAQPDATDEGFFVLPTSDDEHAGWLKQFDTWGLPTEFSDLVTGLRNGEWTGSDWIPAAPGNTERPVFLFKSDFNQIRNPHPVSHYYGKGWLASEATYSLLRDRLLAATVRLVQHNWMTESWEERLLPTPLPKAAAVYVSNIGSTLPLQAHKLDMYTDVIAPKIEASVLPDSAKELTRRLMIQFLQLNNLVNESIVHKNTEWICQFGRYASADIQNIIDTYS